MMCCFNPVINFSFPVQHLVHPATADFCSRWGFFLVPSLSTSTISFPSHPIDPNSFSLGLSLCWCLCPGCSLPPVPISPLPRSLQISICPSAPTSSAGPTLPFSAVLQFSLPAPSLLGASFPFLLLLPILACPLHLPSPGLRGDPAGRWWQQASHQPLPVTKAAWDEPVCGTLGWHDMLCLAQTDGFLIWETAGAQGGQRQLLTAVDTLIVKSNTLIVKLN